MIYDKSPIGKQDQYAAAYGGVKVYRFKKDGTVGIENINMKSETKAQLNDEIICFYIGGNRSANEILKLRIIVSMKSKKRI